MSRKSNALKVLDYFTTRHLGPTRTVHRHDGTLEHTWHVDDCDERYVRVTSSAHGPDHVLVARDRRDVDAHVLANVGEIFDWVRSRLVRLDDASRSEKAAVVAGGS